MAKWAARFALGLSNAVPGLRLGPSCILDEPDIGLSFSPSWKFKRLIPVTVSAAGSDMTDGCGYINKRGLLQLHAHFKWKTFPTAIQCRLGGTKASECWTSCHLADLPCRAFLFYDLIWTPQKTQRCGSGRLRSKSSTPVQEFWIPHFVLLTFSNRHL
jgi:RNA dependent RNA polymerase